MPNAVVAMAIDTLELGKWVFVTACLQDKWASGLPPMYVMSRTWTFPSWNIIVVPALHCAHPTATPWKEATLHVLWVIYLVTRH